MVRSVTPTEAQALIRAGEIDIVDVREAHEYEEGHLPGARSVPLGELKSQPKEQLPRDNVLFVCARGGRSQTAADLAERLGFARIFQLEGGTQAWQKAGFAVEKPPPAPNAPRSSSAASSSPAQANPSCGLPDPGLDRIVGSNLRVLRQRRNMSLDEAARLTGVSRTLLGQIELGKAPPSVSVVWKLAQAFKVHFSALLAAQESVPTSILRKADAKRLASPDGRFSSRPLYPATDDPDAEFYELFLAAHSREDAEPHAPGTREHLVVSRGRLEVHAGGECFELAQGDAIVFSADVPHAYVNPGSEECWMYLVMTYGAPASDP